MRKLACARSEELNPRIGWFDLKYFNELRPGLIGWCFLNLAHLAAQYESLGYVSMSMLAVNLFQGLYVWDALYHERSILTTMDITTDGFGYMLCFGDLAWVPFTYSLQAYYLVSNDPNLPPLYILLITALNIVGYKVFRGANSEKDMFRRDPEGEAVKHLRYIPTKRGTKLLVSGYWGLGEKRGRG